MTGTPLLFFGDIHSPRTPFYWCLLYCGMHRCGEFANIIVKLKHHFWQMILSSSIDDMSASHTDDLHVFWVFFCIQFWFIAVYFIEGLACMAVLRLIAFNESFIGDRWMAISGWLISPGGRNTTCIFWGYSFATNAVLSMCTLLRYAPMWRICKYCC